MEKELAILMADLTGYTAMTDIHGGASAAKMVNKYMELVGAACTGTARLMQRVGDQVVIIADNGSDLIDTVSELHALTSGENHFLSIHAGMHFGPVFIEGNNLFGSTINVASRIMNLASRGQTLCSKSLFKKLPSELRENFKSIGTHRLKNILDEVELFELLVTSSHALPLDPVCHMHVDPSKTQMTYFYMDTLYHFCSTHCRDLFMATPDRFLGHAAKRE